MRSVAIAVLIAAGCADPPPTGVFTQSECPTVDPPTFASFGQPFFTSYCIACHSQGKTGADRQGAPVTIDFDTRSLVRENTSRIDKQAAFGPSAMNRLMPLDGNPAPSDPERVRLGEYIACEVAQ